MKKAVEQVEWPALFVNMQRLIKRGYVIRTDEYELEDPFFCRWILSKLH